MKNLFLPIILLLTAPVNQGSTIANKSPGNTIFDNIQFQVRISREVSKDDSTSLFTGWYYLADSSNGVK